ncbi:DUF1698 domain-containing protein [bacterium]|jgi:2-polyprenyl-3-methyl-5-hydroxy-6-metoxy-1,4-benzoquinol methylase|nr:DUF1698 domain-containing protein [bacterium]
MINKRKIFITGITAAGKSYMAKKIMEEQNISYIDFESQWVYEKNAFHIAENFLDSLPSSFVVDAIPRTLVEDKSQGNPLYHYDYSNFNKFYTINQKDTQIICVIMSDLKQWLKNVISKPYYSKEKMKLGYDYDYYNAWIHEYTTKLDTMYDIIYYDSSSNKVLNQKEFETIREGLLPKIQELLEKKQTILKDYIDMMPYDKWYQDIQCIGFEGYSKSWKTWDNIKGIIETDKNWKNKTVIDVGCFHGYFSFICEQLGAKKVIGLDNDVRVLDTANIIKKIMPSNVEFLQWEAGNPTPVGDVALVLNMLHHTKDPLLTLMNLNVKTAIFEIEKSQMPLVSKCFNIIKKIKSHRVDITQNRIILVGEKI